MRALATVIAIVLAAGAGPIQMHGAAPTTIILAADGAVAPEGTPPSPETSTAVPEQGGGQGAPEASAPPDLSKTEVGKPGMGCCTMLPNGAVMCRC
jgi:hypothetical protein